MSKNRCPREIAVHNLTTILVLQANEREKRYLNTYPTRNDLLNEVEQLKSKVAKQKKLETTCLQQEKVIEKLEKVVVSYKKKAKEKAQPGKS